MITLDTSTTIDPPGKPWLIDLHCHTRAGSPDSSGEPGELAAAAAARTIAAICITDHDHFWPEGALPRAASGVLIFTGSEVNTDAGHVLVFGVEAYQFGFHHPQRLAEAVEEVSGAMIWAHPYRRSLLPGVEPNTPPWEEAIERAAANPLARLVHAIESSNGRGTVLENRFAGAVATALGKPQTGSSDAHAGEEAGRSATALDRPVSDIRELAGLIRDGAFRPGPASAPDGEPGRQ